MDPLTLALHLIGFVLPALGLAALLGLALWMRGPGRLTSGLRWRQASRATGWMAAAGVVVLAAGLIGFGRDGRMLTYAALVLVLGSLAWWFSRRTGRT